MTPPTALALPLPTDPHRPTFHFLPPANWINDPNGLMYWQGTYHLFYQHNPTGPFHANMHWGHATSTNLLDWTVLPLALTPTPDFYDAAGCWSGCAVDDHGTPTLLYTAWDATRRETPCLARSTDGLRTWQKHPAPVIATPPSGYDLLGFRDHCVWREGNQWHQIIGAGLRGIGGAALHYHTTDLRHWEFDGPLYVGNLEDAAVSGGTMWECPQLFRFADGRAALMISVHTEQPCYTAYFVGHYEAGHFVATEPLRKLDYGDRQFYAPQALTMPDGRIILWGWSHEADAAERWHERRWAGALSLPREVTLSPAGDLCIEPVAELTALRGAHTQLAPTRLEGEVTLEAVRGTALELHARIAVGTGAVGLAVRRAPDATECTTIWYDPTCQTLTLDRSRSSLDPLADNTPQGGPLVLAPNEALDLRVFIDASVIEICANRRAYLTSRIYPTRIDSVGIALIADQPAELLALDAWDMRAITIAEEVAIESTMPDAFAALNAVDAPGWRADAGQTYVSA